MQLRYYLIILVALLPFSAVAQLSDSSTGAEELKRQKWIKEILGNKINKPGKTHKYLKAPAGPALYTSYADSVRAPFIVYVPKSYDPKKPTLLIVYLHNDPLIRQNFQFQNPAVAEQPIFAIADTFNTIVMFPFAKMDFIWGSDMRVFDNIFAQIKLTEEYYNIDKKRIYIGGQGQGGIATYWFIINAPGIFAGFYTFSAVIKEPGTINLSSITKEKPLYTLNAKDDKVMDFKVVKQLYDQYKTMAPGWHFETVDTGGHRVIFTKNGNKYVKALIGELLEATMK